VASRNLEGRSSNSVSPKFADDAVDASRPRTRLLMVNSTLHIGGAEQVAATLSCLVNPGQFDVGACYLKEPGLVGDQMLRAGVNLVPLPGLVPGRRDYFTSLKLRRLIRERGTQVIHTHDIHGLIDGAICRLSMPSLRHVHTFHFGNYPHRYRHYMRIEGSLWRVPDALIAVGHVQAKSIRSCYGIPENRLRVLWNGVDDHFNSAGRAAAEEFAHLKTPGIPLIGSISTLIPQKGLEHLLEAASLLKQSGEEFQLVIAGHGVLKESLEAQARNLGLADHVKFLGWVSEASRKLLPICDIFVQSSLWEAMSIVVLEAMAAAKPMVVTSVGENPHVVLHESTGLTVSPGDPRALADSLRRLLRDERLRENLGGGARRRYEEHFTNQHMVRAHESLYSELVNR
jgi:glycosyltransferase involved in cell wall biosynthesis